MDPEPVTVTLEAPSTSAEVTGHTVTSGPGPSAEGSSSRPLKRKPHPDDNTPLDDLLYRRTTIIKEGDNVLLKLPSDAVKAVVASQDGLVQLGKFGAFPASLLLGLHFDVTYEIVTPPSDGDSTRNTPVPVDWAEEGQGPAFGQARGKKDKKDKKGKGKGQGEDGVKTNPGWRNTIRPLQRQEVMEAVIDDIQETNEFIDDIEFTKTALLSQEEILELRAQGVTTEEMIQKQMERHDQFALKTDFSKEKWRKRKEKKFSQTFTPMSPSAINITSHYLSRSPQSILHLREDTLSQLLSLANIRPEGRYLVVDDTGGLVVASLIERMGAQGRILQFTDSDSPPAWGVLATMNFGERELECVKWLNWMEADEDYQRPPPPAEDDLPQTSAQKTQNRLRRHNAQVAELNATRDELHRGTWDGVVLATELNPISILARVMPYLAGSSTITVYSPYMQVLVEVLQMSKRDPNYLFGSLTESWTRTYQVLPGRTHPMMTTSATGGYLFHATRVHPSDVRVESNQRFKRRREEKQRRKAKEQANVNGQADEGRDVGQDESSGVDEDELEL